MVRAHSAGLPDVIGATVGSPYTRSNVEMGTLGERRQAEFDDLYGEATQVLTESAKKLRTVAERLRHSHLDDVAARDGAAASAEGARAHGERLAREHALLTRLEVVHQELEQNWRFLERGSLGSWDLAKDADGRADAGQADAALSRTGVAMQLLEAREQERSIVASELHDGPAQALANAIFQVDIVERTLRADPQGARTELSTLRDQLDRDLERLRGFIHQLHPSLQPDDGLDQAIEELAQRMERENGIQVEVHLAAPLELLDPTRTRAVLRVAQEALRNVRKHSQASQVRLATFIEPDGAAGADAPRWILEIADNGRGFPVDEVLEQTSKRHFGLRFMRERAQLIGASLEIASNPAKGTTIRLALEPAKRS
jgi:signal transduction histidine kinase